MGRIKDREAKPGLLVRPDLKRYSEHIKPEKMPLRGIIIERILDDTNPNLTKKYKVVWNTGQVEDVWIWQLRKY